jgi:hypothetical protein
MEGVPTVAKGWEMPVEEFKQLVGKAILYRHVQRVALDLRIPAFRVNVVNYTVALIAEVTARRIDLIRVWEAQGISDLLRQMAMDWLPRVAAALTSSAGSRNPTEWFKAEQCWKQLREVTRGWTIPDEVKCELVAIEGRSGSSHVTANHIARCLEIDAETWFKIQVWGSETGKLEQWQCGIANTLAGYAAGGWRRKPSEKQAKRGVEILELAEEFLARDGRED